MTSIASHISIRTLLLLVSACLAWTAPAQAQGCDIEPENSEPAPYHGPDFPGNCQQTFRLFVPSGAVPPGGWPVMIDFEASGFGAGSDVTCISEGSFRWKVLRAGIAIVAARGTPSSVPLPDPCVAPAFEGSGLFHPPGYVPHDLVGAGPGGTDIAPYDSVNWDMLEKDTVLVVQYVRYHAGEPFHLLEDLDPRRIAVNGRSGGAISLMWPTLGPDRRLDAPFAGRSGQYAMPTRPDVAVLHIGAVWFPYFSPDVAIKHFGEFDPNEGSAHSTNPATTLGAADPEVLQSASALYYDENMLNPSLPLLMVYGDESASTDHEPGTSCGSGLAFCFDDEGLEEGVHPAWSGYAWKFRHPGTELIITNESAFNQKGSLEAVLIESPSEVEDTIVDWLVARLAEAPTVWTTISQAGSPGQLPIPQVATSGTAGVPILIGSGSLEDLPMSLHLSQAKPSSTAYLVLGLTALKAPYCGGVIVPSLELAPIPVAVAASGEALVDVITGSTPPAAIPPAFSQVWVQYWIQDRASACGPDGLVGSNALLVEF